METDMEDMIGAGRQERSEAEQPLGVFCKDFVRRTR